ncbi:hypothetical protein FND52_03835 [Atlantibacter subterranea]|uniref:hypothetical protein n=1 Tax=Atlantibacter subterraneus TaxID=255519 RepID=UPI0011831A15|nr:hypothetical protein [Atlantibacter subterranea]TSJ59570.1 hypothetical protein FND52_03835 [Atlantibacter subterranea]
MKEMTHKQLIRATYVVAKFKDSETAQLLTELAGRLDYALAAARTACAERATAMNAEIEWETAMQKATGEDNVDDVVLAIEKLKAGRGALAAEKLALKSSFKPDVIPEEAVEAFTETAILDHDWNDTSEWSWVENDTDVIRAVLDAMSVPETPVTDSFLAEVRKQGVIEFAAAMAAIHAECQKGGYFDRQVKVYAKAQELAESYLKQRHEEKTEGGVA